MVMEIVAILLLMLGNQVQLFYVFGTVVLWGVMIVALVSAADYYRRYNLVLSDQPVADFEEGRRRSTHSSRRAG